MTNNSNAKQDDIARAAQILLDPSSPISRRFRALFLLRNAEASNNDLSRAAQAMIDCLLLKGLIKASALLKHECAYCLGQIGAHPSVRSFVVPALFDILCDSEQPVIARHEAGEALGAIGAVEYLPQLQEMASQKSPTSTIPIEVIQTCELAVDRIQYISAQPSLKDKVLVSPFDSVDPAPAADEAMADIPLLGQLLCDLKQPLFDRYKAMFALRNIAGATSDTNLADEAIKQLIRGFEVTEPEEALLRHEVAFVLGQLGAKVENVAVKSLLCRLEDPNENPMVRHEAAEALGSVANDDCTSILQKFATDKEPIVSESCVVALDLAEYEKSDSFEYATLS